MIRTNSHCFPATLRPMHMVSYLCHSDTTMRLLSVCLRPSAGLVPGLALTSADEYCDWILTSSFGFSRNQTVTAACCYLSYLVSISIFTGASALDFTLRRDYALECSFTGTSPGLHYLRIQVLGKLFTGARPWTNLLQGLCPDFLK
jgi:hypothetical protein